MLFLRDDQLERLDPFDCSVVPVTVTVSGGLVTVTVAGGSAAPVSVSDSAQAERATPIRTRAEPPAMRLRTFFMARH